MKKLAFENPEGDLFTLTDEMIQKGLSESRNSDRLRIIQPIHRTQDAGVQRLINFLQPGTYIRPHKHPLPHASESVILLRGAIRFFTFSESGSILNTRELAGSPYPGMIDIEPDVWHSFLVLEEDTILFECKKGPYDPKTDKEFAGWAPEEEDLHVNEWMEKISS